MGVKTVPPAEMEKALAEYYNGDTGKVQTVMVVASKALAGTKGIYLPRNPYGRKKDGTETSFDRFKKGLEEIEESGAINFLCDRFPVCRVNVSKKAPGYNDRLTLTPGDDARVTSEIEKQLRDAVGADGFKLAKEELIRLRSALPPDDSGQMFRAAMDLVIINCQILQIDVQIREENDRERITAGDKKPHKANTDKLFDHKKVMLIRKDDLMKRLGLDSGEILKRGGPKSGSLASAADALKEQIDGKLATASLIGEISAAHAEKGKPAKKEKIDAIDMAYIKTAAKRDEMNGGDP
jgi:hypothetical protein